MENLFFLGGKLPKIDSKIRLQFRDHAIITVEPDQENSVSIMKPPLYAWGGVGSARYVSCCSVVVVLKGRAVILSWILDPIRVCQEIMGVVVKQ